MMLLQMPHLQKMEVMKLDPDDHMFVVVVVLSIISSIYKDWLVLAGVKSCCCQK